MIVVAECLVLEVGNDFRKSARETVGVRAVRIHDRKYLLHDTLVGVLACAELLKDDAALVVDFLFLECDEA